MDTCPGSCPRMWPRYRPWIHPSRGRTRRSCRPDRSAVRPTVEPRGLSRPFPSCKRPLEPTTVTLGPACRNLQTLWLERPPASLAPRILPCLTHLLSDKLSNSLLYPRLTPWRLVLCGLSLRLPTADALVAEPFRICLVVSF